MRTRGKHASGDRPNGKFTWLMPRVRVAGEAGPSSAQHPGNIPGAFAIVDQIVQDCKRGWWQPVGLERRDLEPFSVESLQAFDRANQVGLPTPDLPAGMSPREAYLDRRRLELGMMNMVGDAGLRELDEASEETKIDQADSWACIIWGYDRINGHGVNAGRVITSAPGLASEEASSRSTS